MAINFQDTHYLQTANNFTEFDPDLSLLWTAGGFLVPLQYW